MIGFLKRMLHSQVVCVDVHFEPIITVYTIWIILIRMTNGRTNLADEMLGGIEFTASDMFKPLAD